MNPCAIARRLAALLATVLLAMSLAACGATATPQPTAAPAPALVATATPPIAAVAVTAAEEAATPEATTTDVSAALEATAAGAVAAAEATANSALAALPTVEPTAAEASDTSGACALLSSDDVEKALGKLDGPPETGPNQEINAPACMYSADKGLVFFSALDGDANRVDELVQRVRQKGAPLQPLSELGDKAYAAAAKVPGAPNANAVEGALIAIKGKTIVTITLLSNLDAAKATDAMRQLARASLARVR